MSGRNPGVPTTGRLMFAELPPRPKPRPLSLLLRVLGALAGLAVVLLVLKSSPPGPAVSPDDPDRQADDLSGGGMAPVELLLHGPKALSETEPVASTEQVGSDLLAEEAVSDPLLDVVAEPFTGDLPGLRKRGFIRVLVSYNRSSFFLTGAEHSGVGVRARGFEHDQMEAYRQFLNRGGGAGRPRLKMVYVPVPFEQLLGALNRGQGDIVAAGMTVTPQRAARVAFSDPYLDGVDELVVTYKPGGRGGREAAGEPVRRLDDLAGRTVRVLRGSSYAEHLETLSAGLQRRGLAPVRVEPVAASLQTEDMLELVNAGVIRVTVADRHLAELWARVLPNIRVHGDLAIHRGGRLAWAVRRDNPELLRSLNAFVGGHRRGTEFGNILFERFYRDTRWVSNPVSAAQRRKLDKLGRLFREYAVRYGFDWSLIAAQAFQESGLVHSARSHKGAIGIMQVKPSTAADRNVAVKNIHRVENNIHAGVKYLAFLRDRYFSDPKVSPEDRLLFALAAYNAGPARIARIRARARRMGLDPNRWLGQVELAALRQSGRETVRYVRNVLKYATAYKLADQNERRRSSERDGLTSAG